MNEKIEPCGWVNAGGYSEDASQFGDSLKDAEPLYSQATVDQLVRERDKYACMSFASSLIERTAECTALKEQLAQAQHEIEKLRQVARNIYEVWASSEGIPLPATAAEAYLLKLVEHMRDEAKNGLTG